MKQDCNSLSNSIFRCEGTSNLEILDLAIIGKVRLSGPNAGASRVGGILLTLLLLTGPVARAAGAAAQIFARAVADLAAKDYPAAEKGFLAVLDLEPANVGAMGNLAVIYSRTNRADRAISVYRRALQLAPADKGLALNLGLAYVRQEEYSEALPIFRHLAASDPDNLQFAELYATCELYTGRIGAAAAALESLRARDATNSGLLYLIGVAYLKQGARDKARIAFDEFLASMPRDRASFVLCKAYYESGLLEEAEEQCRQTIAANAQYPGAHRELGKVLVSRRSPDAEASLTEAIERDPRDAEALYFLGALLIRENRVDEAERLLQRAKDLNPGFWGNYFYLGKAAMQKKRPGHALALLEKAAELNAGEPAVFYQLARVYSTLGRAEDSRRAMQRVRDLQAATREQDR